MPRPAERGSPTEREAAAELGQTMLIGEVSAVTGLTQRTLRYYEEIGLLPPATRLEGGFRLYSDADVTRLRRIIELKSMLGFSLVEVKEMIDLEEERRERRSAYHREADPAVRREHVARSLELAGRLLAKLESRLSGLLDLREKTLQRVVRYEHELAELETADSSGCAEASDEKLGRVLSR
jgi:MerR family transcriptional regulator, repressor of the yfmOP operon